MSYINTIWGWESLTSVITILVPEQQKIQFIRHFCFSVYILYVNNTDKPTPRDEFVDRIVTSLAEDDDND